MTPRPRVRSLFQIEGLPIIVVFALILGLFMYTAPEVFLAPNIYMTFLSTAPPLILLATGLTFVIAAGEIDLSFPAVIAFSGFVFAILFKDYNLGWIAVVATLASGALVGIVNGYLIARIGIPSFIATLGNAILLVRHRDRALGRQILCPAGRRGHERLAVDRRPLRRPEFLCVAGPALDSGAVDAAHRRLSLVHPQSPPLRRTCAVHRRLRTTSRAWSGSTSTAEKIKLYTLMGVLASVAAMMLTLENKNFFGNQGQGYLLTAIAAVLIGGTSIFGGRATIVGTFFGCCIIWMLEAGLVATGLTGAWVRTVQGLIFLVSIIFYLFVEEPQRRAEFFARFARRTDSGGRDPVGKAPAPDRRGKASGLTRNHIVGEKTCVQ